MLKVDASGASRGAEFSGALYNIQGRRFSVPRYMAFSSNVTFTASVYVPSVWTGNLGDARGAEMALTLGAGKPTCLCVRPPFQDFVCSSNADCHPHAGGQNSTYILRLGFANYKFNASYGFFYWSVNGTATELTAPGAATGWPAYRYAGKTGNDGNVFGFYTNLDDLATFSNRGLARVNHFPKAWATAVKVDAWNDLAISVARLPYDALNKYYARNCQETLRIQW
jgi:hypothetical protein